MTTDPIVYDVFLSYSNKDRKTATLVAEGLKSHGFSVWWDREILPGQEFIGRIEEHLESSKCVSVLWSQNSIQSRFVTAETEHAAENKKLVPVRIEDVKIPYQVRIFHTIDLLNWKGDPNHPDFLKYIQGVKTQIDGYSPVGPIPQVLTSKSSKKWLWIALILFFALSAFSVWTFFLRPNTQNSHKIAGNLIQTPLTGDGLTKGCCLSPDGNFLLYTRDTGGQYSLRLKQIATGTEKIIVPQGKHGIRSPLFSPDGTFIFYALAGPIYSLDYLAEYDIYRTSQVGGNPQRILKDVIGRRFAISPQGNRLAFQRTFGDSVLILTSLTNGTDEQVISRQIRNITVANCLAFSSDGTRLYSTRRDTLTGHRQILVHSINKTSDQVLSGGPWKNILDLHSMPDGSGLLIVGQPVRKPAERQTDLWLLPTDSQVLQRLTQDLTTYTQVSTDSAGQKFALSFYALKRTLRVLDINTPTAFLDVSTDIVTNGTVVWDENNKFLANQRLGNRVGLVTMNTDGTNHQQVLTDVNYITEFDLSSSTRQLAFTSRQGQLYHIWLADDNGTAPHRLAQSSGIERFPKFSPDGSWLLFARQATAGAPRILTRYNLKDKTSLPLAQVTAIWPGISPDGETIAAYFKHPEIGKYKLGLIPATGGQPQLLDIPENYDFLCWNPQGTGLTCYVREGATPNIWNVPLDGSTPRQLTNFPAGHMNIPGLAWNASGDSLVAALEMTDFDAIMLEWE